MTKEVPITLIAAVAKNGVIGNGNKIPWHIPEDFKHFSETTTGHPVIMGSRTWDSLPARFRPLPNRTNIVVSSQKRDDDEDSFWVSDIKTAILAANTDAYPNLSKEIFVIGGASIYAQTIKYADRLLISLIDQEPEGDTFFPEIGPEWIVSSRDERTGFTILDYRREG